MKRRDVILAAWILAAWLCLGMGSAGWALDTVKTTSSTVTGQVVKMTRQQVDVERSGVVRNLPANEVVYIHYSDEPSLLRTARGHVQAGRYNDALEALNKVPPGDLTRAEMTQDLAYYRALASARLALGGGAALADARDQMRTFVHGNINSYHFYEGCEVLGNLYAAMGDYANAEKYYAQLETSPWPDYQMRGGVAIGRARLAQGKAAEARQSFAKVLAIEATGDAAQSQRLAAQLGEAACQVAEGKHDEAIQAVEGIIANANPEDVDLCARAYNILGSAHRKAGRDQEALLAFLHVDILYFAVPETHAEALASLAVLWEAVHKPQRAAEARQVLQERYKNSPWAKQGGS
ncbi:MAG: tetratricopeptide repeat protein [Pirellulales bacterium]|nr:tetratricopeptide repeat protein [Pirellulales bacterium]